MEYNYELLRKCHGLRFRATLSDKREEGIIKVGEDGITLCYGAKDPGRLFIFERSKTLSFTEQSFGILPNDFEIVPRSPETFQDWQMGDKISRNADVCTVIFRYGEVVIFKHIEIGGNWCCSSSYTCEELFRTGYRLVLTDIEKQIIEERKWKPQAGDICFAETNTRGQRFIFIYENNAYSLANFYDSGWKLREDVLWEYSRIRPATDEERQQLFDAMAKEGKRWNAERKVVEDIPKPHEFKDCDYDYRPVKSNKNSTGGKIMTREIKFRGRSTDTGEWVYGYLLQDGDLSFIVESLKEFTETPFNECLVNPDTVGQYAGLKDRNGEEIYEGDIVKTPLLDPIFGDVLSDAFDNVAISFHNGSFVVSYYEGCHKIYLQDLYDEIEVIGNIHDNPELLGRSMKAPEQIRAWLKSREWFPQFMRNAEVLSCDRGQDTVLDAFCWEYTPEGLNFWSEKNREFQEWYFSEKR